MTTITTLNYVKKSDGIHLYEEKFDASVNSLSISLVSEGVRYSNNLQLDKYVSIDLMRGDQSFYFDGVTFTKMSSENYNKFGDLTFCASGPDRGSTAKVNFYMRGAAYSSDSATPIQNTTYTTHITTGCISDKVIISDTNYLYGYKLLGNDYISTLSGADSIVAGYGNDTIYAGDDNDTIYGGYDNDLIYAGSGNDVIYGGSGNDLIDIASGSDKAYGGDGNDVLRAQVGTDSRPTLTGGSGADIFMISSKFNTSDSSGGSDWGKNSAQILGQTSMSTLGTLLGSKAALDIVKSWNPIAAAAYSFGQSAGSLFLGRLFGTMAQAKSSPEDTAAFVTIADFDPQEDTLQVKFKADVTLDATKSACDGTVWKICDTTNTTRAVVNLHNDFKAQFKDALGNIDSAAMTTALNHYLDSGLTVDGSKGTVTSNGVNINLAKYGDYDTSSLGVEKGDKLYLVGSFSSQTFTGGTGGTKNITGAAYNDVIMNQAVDTSGSGWAANVTTNIQATLSGGHGSDLMIGGAERDAIYGGGHSAFSRYDGDDLLYGLGGDDTLTGGYGNDTFYVLTSCKTGSSGTVGIANSGNDIITDFNQLSRIDTESDTIYIDNTQVRAGGITYTQVGADTVLTFAGQSNTVTLQNLTTSHWSFSEVTDATGHVQITGTYTGPTGGCFITTATAEQFGWADDCQVLSVLRWFRDNVMAERPDWKADIATYYRIAPQIVEATRHDQKLYKGLWENSLRKAVSAVVAGKYQRAYDVYRHMVNKLATQYLKG